MIEQLHIRYQARMTYSMALLFLSDKTDQKHLLNVDISHPQRASCANKMNQSVCISSKMTFYSSFASPNLPVSDSLSNFT